MSPAPIPSRRSPFKTPKEMEAIRDAHQSYLEKHPVIIKPEANKVKPLCYFEISRYVEGPFRGLFLVAQMITEDKDGKPLKKPERKLLAEGVDIHIAMVKLEDAARAKVFK